MEKKTLGTFLSALRRAQGLTQQEVADRLAVSNKAVSRWERDEAMPDILLLPAIADLFGVTVDELLRGERMRNTPPRETAAPEIPAETLPDTADTIEQPSAEKVTPDPRALRGLRAMMNRAKSRFRSAVILSLALILAGLFIMGGISYGFYRPSIGFVVLLLFLIGALTVTALSATHLRDILNEQTFGEDTRLPDTEIAAACRFYAAGLLRVICIAVMAILVALPLVLIRDRHLVNSVLSAKSYAPMALAIGIACMVAILCLHNPIMRLLCAPWADVLPHEGGIPSLPKALRRRLWYMNIVQLGSFTIGISLCIICNALDLGYAPYISEFTRINLLSLACFALGVLICFIAPYFFLRSHRHLRDDESLPPFLWAMGKVVMTTVAVRNLLLGLTVFLTLGFGLSFGSTSIDGGTPQYYQYWDEDVLFMGLLVAAAIIVTEQILRKHLMKKSKP